MALTVLADELLAAVAAELARVVVGVRDWKSGHPHVDEEHRSRSADDNELEDVYNQGKVREGRGRRGVGGGLGIWGDLRRSGEIRTWKTCSHFVISSGMGSLTAHAAAN